YFGWYSPILSDYVPAVHSINIRGNGVITRDIGFQVTVNQFTYKSVHASRTGLAFILFNDRSNDNRGRLIRILGEHSTQKNLTIKYSRNLFRMEWANALFCQSYSLAPISINASVKSDGDIEYDIRYSSRYLTHDCMITIEVSEGIYNGRAYGNVEITDSEVIYREDFSIPYNRSQRRIILVPNPNLF
ncbi:hypothetical protein EWB00_010854, partial [Schistosoma japonicum]